MMIQFSDYQKALNSVTLDKGGKFVLNLIIPVLIVLSLLLHTNAYAAELSNLKPQDQNYAGVHKHKISSNLTVRGWKLTPNIYLGQTKAFGDTSYGLMIDKGDYAFGVVDQKISIMKSF